MKNNPKQRKASVAANPVSRRAAPVHYVDEPPRRSRRDPYDAYDRPVRRPPQSRKRRRKKRRSGFSGVSALLLLVILAMCALGYWRMEEYEKLSEMKKIVSSQTFYAGTTVDGIDVSNMTLQQALDHWNNQIEPAYRQTTVVIDGNTRITAEQLGYSSNYDQVLSGAWSSGRTGSLVERYRRIRQYMAQPRAHQISRSMYSEQLVRDFAARAAQQVNTEPRNASVRDFNVETYVFEFEAEQAGRMLNQEALVSSITSALSAGGGNVSLQIEPIAPQVTRENVAAQYGMIASAVTNASSSSKNRLSNIRQSLKSINGIWLDPGESFSFNQVVGERTANRGYKKATAYSGGKVTEELGGGICQVSTTLFNAAVKADLQMDERHSHSLTVSYVDLGKDAAVDWGNKDLRFTNNSDDRIYICGYLTDDKRVRIGVFGKLLPNGTSITVEGVKTGTSDYKTEYQMSFELASGQTKVIQEGKKGYRATAYKIWWDANGNEIRRSELCKSNYQSTPEIIAYGP